MFPPTESETKEYTRRAEMFVALDPKHYSGGWYNVENMRDTMRNAIIIRLAQNLIMCSGAEEAKEFQQFLDNVLSNVVTFTSNSQIQGLVVAASQMVEKASWEKRQELILMFMVYEGR